MQPTRLGSTRLPGKALADILRRTLAPLADPAVDIVTLATVIRDEDELAKASVVKAVVGLKPGETVGRALYFSRAVVPSGRGDHYRHVGLYTYRRTALARYVRAAPSVLEQRERLEQLRALELGLRIDVALVDAEPFGVDTAADLARARELLAPGRR